MQAGLGLRFLQTLKTGFLLLRLLFKPDHETKTSVSNTHAFVKGRLIG